MKILAVESSASPASCAVVEDGKVLAVSYTHTGLTHSQTLVPMIEDMLKNAAVCFDDISLIAIAHGPGSFTGVRIGVAAVKGLAFARGIPCSGVSTLAAMARMAEGAVSGVICAAMDARREQVYAALFSAGENGIARITEDAALPVREVARLLRNRNETVWFMGDGAVLCHQACAAENLQNIRLLPPQFRYQNAVGVALEAAVSGISVTGDELRPCYLRLPQAERELRAKKGAL